MVEIAAIDPFNWPVNAVRGDTLVVTHTFDHPRTKQKTVAEKRFPMTKKWSPTHSLLYLNQGKMKHIVGTQETVKWLTGLVGLQQP